MFKLLLFQHR